MSGPTQRWQKVFQQASESRQAFDRFYEKMLAELHAAESARVGLAQKILSMIERTRSETSTDVNISETRVADLIDGLVDDIETLCKEQLQKKGE